MGQRHHQDLELLMPLPTDRALGLQTGDGQHTIPSPDAFAARNGGSGAQTLQRIEQSIDFLGSVVVAQADAH